VRPKLSVQDVIDFAAAQGEIRFIDWSAVPIVLGLPPSIFAEMGARNSGQEPVDDWHDLETAKLDVWNGVLALSFGPPPHGYAKAMAMAAQVGFDLSDDEEDEVPE
jgi:hypothetical protein